jgi:prevent-host-death family protein
MSAKPITIHAAKTQLSRLIERACDGEEIIIARRNEPVVKLVPVRKKPVKRKFGSMPLPEEELERWGV